MYVPLAFEYICPVNIVLDRIDNSSPKSLKPKSLLEG